jgi:hypothetical protein
MSVLPEHTLANSPSLRSPALEPVFFEHAPLTSDCDHPASPVQDEVAEVSANIRGQRRRDGWRRPLRHNNQGLSATGLDRPTKPDILPEASLGASAIRGASAISRPTPGTPQRVAFSPPPPSEQMSGEEGDQQAACRGRDAKPAHAKTCLTTC